MLSLTRSSYRSTNLHVLFRTKSAKSSITGCKVPSKAQLMPTSLYTNFSSLHRPTCSIKATKTVSPRYSIFLVLRGLCTSTTSSANTDGTSSTQTVRQQIESAMKGAMLAKNRPLLEAIRKVRSKIIYTDKESGDEAGDDAIQKVMMEMRREAEEAVVELEAAAKLSEVAKQSSAPLIAEEKLLIEVLNQYLPKQMDKQTLEAEIRKAMELLEVKSVKDLGKLIKHVQGVLGAQATSKDIGETAKAIISSPK